MRYRELIETHPYKSLGLYDPADDEFHRREPDDTRKPQLTLRHLNKLKHQRNARRREQSEKLELVKRMYGPLTDIEPDH